MDLSTASPYEILKWAASHSMEFMRDVVVFYETGVYDTDLILLAERDYHVMVEEWKRVCNEAPGLRKQFETVEVLKMLHRLGIDNLIDAGHFARAWYELVVEFESEFADRYDPHTIVSEMLPMGLDYGWGILQLARDHEVSLQEYSFGAELPVELFATIAKGGLSHESAEWVRDSGLNLAEVVAVTAGNRDVAVYMEVLHELGVAPADWSATLRRIPVSWLGKNWDKANPAKYGIGLLDELLAAGWTDDDKLPMDPEVARGLLDNQMRPAELARWLKVFLPNSAGRFTITRLNDLVYLDWAAKLKAAGIAPSHVADYRAAVKSLGHPVTGGIVKLVNAGIGPKEIVALRDRWAPKRFKGSHRGYVADTPEALIEKRDRSKEADAVRQRAADRLAAEAAKDETS